MPLAVNTYAARGQLPCHERGKSPLRAQLREPLWHTRDFDEKSGGVAFSSHHPLNYHKISAYAKAMPDVTPKVMPEVVPEV